MHLKILSWSAKCLLQEIDPIYQICLGYQLDQKCLRNLRMAPGSTSNNNTVFGIIRIRSHCIVLYCMYISMNE